MFQFSEFLCVLLLLLFAVKTDSQRIVFSPDDGHYRSRARPPVITRPVSVDCNCIFIRRCPILRNRPDWTTAGETCEFGYGDYRRVCCPRNLNIQNPGSNRNRARPTKPLRTTPETTTVRNNGGIVFPSGDDDDRPRPRPVTRRPVSGDCNCILIRSCPILRNRADWRTAGETCEFGYGDYRRVCCPRNTNLSAPNPGTDRNPPMPPTPSPIAPEPTTIVINTRNKAGCGQSPSATGGFVMGGENSTEGMWPWMAAIRFREKTNIFTPWCSGFLIDRIHVVSAAHCFEIRDPERYSARVGSINQDEADEYLITRIEIPTGYTEGMFYDDIVVLTLDREVDYQNFNPICLPDEKISKMGLIGEGTTVAGWGADRPGGLQKTYLKHLNRIPVVSNQNCHRILRSTLRNGFKRQFPRGINKGFICAGFLHGGQDACGGDSGGPLMYLDKDRSQWFVVGIVSFGYSCGEPGIPGGYTRVSNYMEWITEKIRN